MKNQKIVLQTSNTGNKYSYVSVLSSSDYLLGLLALYDSLMQTSTSYPFNVIISNNISDEIEAFLKYKGICVIKMDLENSIELPDQIHYNNEAYHVSRWTNTFVKLLVFELIEFDKIVFIDSDMMILRNIDYLFDYPHMAATNAGAKYPGNESWVELNSGIFVAVPNKGYISSFLKVLPEVIIKKKYFGDQDILQEFYKDWKHNDDLNIGEEHNVFASYLSFYIKKLKYGIRTKDREKNIAVVHFIGYPKPWMYKDNFIIRLFKFAKYYFYYFTKLNDAKYLKLKYKIFIIKSKKEFFDYRTNYLIENKNN